MGLWTKTKEYVGIYQEGVIGFVLGMAVIGVIWMTSCG